MPQLRMPNARRNQTTTRMKAPPHPFPELQGPFEESMTELERLSETEVPSDAASRRTILLDAPTYERVIAGRWKQRPGEKYHPLWKIVAQLSFGIHLLAENLAKSEEEVMQILQGHIDEIDLFLERTTEDFALAQEDIQERMRCLQLPLQHPKVFDRMLEDRTFRNSIVDGNEKIEHIVARTQCAMRDSLKDAQKGLDATSALEQYLASLEDSWGRRSSEHEAVFEAMLENVEGWRAAFIDLHTQGDKLGRLLQELTDVINQMQQRAGEVSRRLIRAQQKQGPSPTSSNNVTYVTKRSPSSSRASRSGTPDRPARKPLPGVPNQDSARLSATQAQRSETAQSTRSVASHRSSDVQKSRASSRAETYASARDSAQARLSAKSPRLVEIRRLSPQSREATQTPPPTQNEPRISGRVASQPVGIMAELPGNAGLGIRQSLGQTLAARQPHHSVPASIGMNSGPVGASRLPMTPSSMASTGHTSYTSAYELPSEPAARHVSAPSLGPAKSIVESSLGSPPSTPGWAKQTFEVSERDRMVDGKAAFRSHPPNADLGSPPAIQSNVPSAPAHQSRFSESVASSIGAPGPEIASSDHTNSVRSSSVADFTQQYSAAGGLQPSPAQNMMNTLPSEPNGGRREFVAELEGNTPIQPQPVADTREAARGRAHQVGFEAVELEAPLHVDTTSTAVGSGQDTTSLSASPGGIAELEHKFAAAIRRSFIATNIELPGSIVEQSSAKTNEVVPEEPKEVNRQGSHKAVSKGVEEIIAQLEALSATSPNLSLKGEEEILVTLPATRYVPDRPPAFRSPKSPKSPDQSVVASGSQPSNVAWSNGGLPQPKAQPSGRNSLESNGSTQSQWRAFFKGQLSPAEFNTSTPHLPSKVSSTHKAIVELQRRGQESSPTLGWQWAPETPDVNGTPRQNRYLSP